MGQSASDTTEDFIELGSARGRGTLLATVLGSGISFLDGLIVNLALPKIDADIGLGISAFQWVVAGYLLPLSCLLLLGGAMGDRFGRRKIYVIGMSVFTLASVACGLAPTTGVLISARVVQGIGGAMLVPASLAIIQATFREEDRGKAIGSWTGLSSTFTAIGPFVGGAFVTYLSWRWAFFINLPLSALAICATLKWVPESRSSGEGASGRLDVFGSLLAAVGLGGIVYLAIEGRRSPVAVAFGIVGVLAVLAFPFVERRVAKPLVPMSLFASRQFTWVNVCTVVFYGAFSSGITFVGVELQTQLHYSALLSGLAILPASIEMLLLAGRFGALGQRIGPRIPMTIGPALVGASLGWLSLLEPGRGYWLFVLPPILLWGLGLSITVAPLTSAALSAIDQTHIGVASAFNNAASRVGSSLGIALIPVLAGVGANASLGGSAFASGFATMLVITAALCALAGGLAFLFVQNKETSEG